MKGHNKETRRQATALVRFPNDSNQLIDRSNFPTTIQQQQPKGRNNLQSKLQRQHHSTTSIASPSGPAELIDHPSRERFRGSSFRPRADCLIAVATLHLSKPDADPVTVPTRRAAAPTPAPFASRLLMPCRPFVRWGGRGTTLRLPPLFFLFNGRRHGDDGLLAPQVKPLHKGS